MIDKSALRGRLFRHLDGLATAHVAAPLHRRGVLAFLAARGTASLEELCREFKANDGYLNVALRTLASQGWLSFETDNYSDHVQYTSGESMAKVQDLLHLYDPIIAFSAQAERHQPDILHPDLLDALSGLFDRFAAGWDHCRATDALTRSLHDQILTHIEGNLVGPLLVKLGMDGVLDRDWAERGLRAADAPAYAPQLGRVLDFFARIGWTTHDAGSYRFTPTGKFFAEKASAYGVIVSYLPTFRRAEELIFGDPIFLKHVAAGDDEQHVDRTMNIWGSGGAHATYFNVVDDIIAEVFNRPIEAQPRGILDMGCGNGAFLEHLHRLVESRTLRGRLLAKHPLFLVGVDYNKASLEVTRRNFDAWKVPAEVIWGDIGNPDQLATDLKDKYQVRLDELLNVRTFLDHNRIYEVPPPKHYRRASSSTGAFAFRGRRVSNNDLEVDLYHHFRKWSPYVQTFGLLMIELHTIPPALAARHMGRTLATAYDTAHGFSDQYIVEIDVLHRIAGDAGLVADAQAFRRFPDAEYATVSVNLFLRGEKPKTAARSARVDALTVD